MRRVSTIFHWSLNRFQPIGDTDTANPLQGLSIEVGGKTFINIANAATLITAFMKWQMELCASTVGLLLKIATGVINKPTTYRFTNAGATTPDVFAFSEEKNGVPFIGQTSSINANSSQDFTKFSALFLQTPANVDSVDITFQDDHSQTFLPAEIDALFALYNQAEADGRLGGVTVLDNTRQSIKSARVNTNATGACVVLVAKLPDAAFRILRGGKR
jgi:hypothetical protein